MIQYYVLIVVLFPYVFTILAKTAKGFDHQKPREALAALSGWRKRAHWVERNSFEILPVFLAGVWVADRLLISNQRLETLALVFIVSRVCYALAYLGNQTILRSLFWAVGLVCILGFFFTF